MGKRDDQEYTIFVTALDPQNKYRVRTSNNPNYLKILKSTGYDDIVHHCFDVPTLKREGVAIIREMDQFKNNAGALLAFEYYDSRNQPKPVATRGRGRPPKPKVFDPIVEQAIAVANRDRGTEIQDEPEIEPEIDQELVALLKLASSKAKQEYGPVHTTSLEDEPF